MTRADLDDGMSDWQETSNALPADLVRALNWLRGRLSEPVQLDQLARAADVRPRTLETHFKMFLGTTPLGWVRRMRLRRAGSVCISGATYEQVKKVLPLSFTDLGPQQVKNIEVPIRAYVARRLVDTPSAAAFTNASRSLPLPDKPSLLSCRSRT